GPRARAAKRARYGKYRRALRLLLHPATAPRLGSRLLDQPERGENGRLRNRLRFGCLIASLHESVDPAAHACEANSVLGSPANCCGWVRRLGRTRRFCGINRKVALARHVRLAATAISQLFRQSAQSNIL